MANGARQASTWANGTPLIPAIESVARSINAEHLQTPLRQARWVRPGELAQGAGRRLRKWDFDQAPLGSPGHLLGYVITSDLEGAARASLAQDFMMRLDAQHLLSANAGMLEVLEVLEVTGPVAFVIAGREVIGFVTPSDINKQPARTHFYLLLANLEAALAEWVRTYYPDDGVALSLLGDEAKKVRRRFERDQARNVSVDLVTGMDLVHLLTIAGQTDDGRDRFGAPDFALWTDWVSKIKSLRNAVMHPVLSLLSSGRPLGDLIAMELGLRTALARDPRWRQGPGSRRR